MTLPNFLIIGAAKAGTSSLYHYLKQHPQIFMSPVKEPYFFYWDRQPTGFQGPIGPGFQNNLTTRFEDYTALFKKVSHEKAIGEASVGYLSSPEAPIKIHNYTPDIKLIAILRNPVQRAFSSFLHARRDQLESLSDFKKALQAEEERIRSNWVPLFYYKDLGFYYRYLQRYYNLFSDSQIRVYLFEDFVHNANKILLDIYDFLEVDSSFVTDVSTQYNESLLVRNRLLQYLIECTSSRLIGRLKLPAKALLPQNIYHPSATILSQFSRSNLYKPKLDATLAQELIMLYQEDILKLQTLLDRDLSIWLR